MYVFRRRRPHHHIVDAAAAAATALLQIGWLPIWLFLSTAYELCTHIIRANTHALFSYIFIAISRFYCHYYDAVFLAAHFNARDIFM